MKLLFISLGCDKNLVDSEVMLGLIQQNKFEITDEEAKAEVIVVNTCCFINDAKEESINTILEMAEWKKKGQLKALVVTGCLAERYKEEIQKEIPEVDAIVGTTGYEDIIKIICEALEGGKVSGFQDINYLPRVKTKRALTTGGYSSYLKIAEGCSKHCTYCIIPQIRGNYRSVPMEDLLEEASDMAEQGVKELMLVAQETTIYGVDLYGRKMLPTLLKKLCEIKGLIWIRILYCYPEEITDELIEVMKEEDKICSYLDIPIQHASDEILKKMGRRTSCKELVDMIEKLRSKIPEVALRTTLITGFPGEGETEHRELVEFVKKMRFERLGVFTYSKEDGTPAAKMEGQVLESVKKARRDEIMGIQQEIAFEKAGDMPGNTITVLIEGSIPEEGVFIGRTFKDAPDVDGYIFVSAGSAHLVSGEFVKVLVTDARGYDLIGEAIFD